MKNKLLFFLILVFNITQLFPGCGSSTNNTLSFEDAIESGNIKIIEKILKKKKGVHKNRLIVMYEFLSIKSYMITYEYKRYCFKIIQYLINSGSNLNEKNEEGNTPLMLAVTREYPDYLELVSLMLVNGADATISNNKGETFFDWMSENPHLVRIYKESKQKRREIILDNITKANGFNIDMPDTLIDTISDMEINKETPETLTEEAYEERERMFELEKQRYLHYNDAPGWDHD